MYQINVATTTITATTAVVIQKRHATPPTQNKCSVCLFFYLFAFLYNLFEFELNKSFFFRFQIIYLNIHLHLY